MGLFGEAKAAAELRDDEVGEALAGLDVHFIERLLFGEIVLDDGLDVLVLLADLLVN